MPPRPSERGSATVMAIAMTAAGLVLCGLVILVGQLLLSVRTIQSLADLAALAASDVSMGVVSGRPCDAARAVAQRQGNYSVYCLMNGPEASVTISAEHLELPSRGPPQPDHLFMACGAVTRAHRECRFVGHRHLLCIVSPRTPRHHLD